MSATIPFTKLHGLGNDFIVIDDFSDPKATQQDLTSDFAKAICHRRFGVGADQILWLKKPKTSQFDVQMDILNADGGIAEMCGNGVRAVALYLYRHSTLKKSEYRISTLAGLITVRINGNNAVVNMGLPQIGNPQGETLEVADRKIHFYEVGMGNPHAILFVPKLDTSEAETLGPAIEVHSRFSKRTNVEFVEVLSPSVLKVRVWERGAGFTLACGTGACAVAVAARLARQTKEKVEIQLPGGNLKISWDGDPNSPVWMEGPAEEVFSGIYQLKQ